MVLQLMTIVIGLFGLGLFVHIYLGKGEKAGFIFILAPVVAFGVVVLGVAGISSPVLTTLYTLFAFVIVIVINKRVNGGD